jgi:hypothetical protein
MRRSGMVRPSCFFFFLFTLITQLDNSFTRTQKKVGRRQGRSGETKIVEKIQAILGSYSDGATAQHRYGVRSRKYIHAIGMVPIGD